MACVDGRAEEISTHSNCSSALDCILELRHGAVVRRLRITDGCADPTDGDQCDLVIDVGETSCSRTVDDGESAAPAPQARTLLMGTYDEPLLPVPDYDLLDLSWTSGLDSLPGVDVVWSTHTHGPPFGCMPLTYYVRDGIPIEIVATIDDRADATLTFPVRRNLQARAGILPAPQAIGDDGGVAGDLDAMLLVLGLLERPDWVAARRISPTRHAALDLFFDLADAGLLGVLVDG